MKIIYKDGHVGECPQEEELHVIRHTAAHVMAQAIKRLYPQADFAFGPATQNGFYYDVDLGDQKLGPEDLEAIEKEMKKIVKENLPIKAFVLNREDSKKLMAERGENYKLEHMDDLADESEFRVQLLPAGRVRRHVPRTAPDLHQGPQGLQDHAAVRRLLEGRQQQQDAHAHQRRGLPHAAGARRVPRQARGSQKARPPQAGPRAGALRLPRRGAGLPLLPAQGHGAAQHAHRLLARGPQEMGLRRDLDPADHAPHAVGDLRPLGSL